jgi:cytochrome P450
LIGPTSGQAPLPPGPRPRSLATLGALAALSIDPLAAFARYAEQYGPIVHFPFGARAFTLLTARADILHVLRDNAKNYDKRTHSYSVIRDVLGESVLTSDGERWRRQRRVVQPALTAAPRHDLVDTTVELTHAMLARWETLGRRGQAFDLQHEMVELTLNVVARVLFGYDARERARRLSRTLTALLVEVSRRAEQLLPWPTELPLPRNVRYWMARAELEAEARAIIARVAGRDAQRSDLLGALQADAEAGDDERTKQLLAVYVAGHETTAMSLVWTLCLLARHHSLLEPIRAEIAAVLGKREPEQRDLGSLVQLDAALRESLRLCPPIWLLERRALADDVIGGYRVARDSVVAISLYALQRSSREFTAPAEFRPERQLGESRQPLPFSAGPRRCAGADFAWTEMMTVLVLVLSRFDLEPLGSLPLPSAGITLRPKRRVLGRVANERNLSFTSDPR